MKKIILILIAVLIVARTVCAEEKTPQEEYIEGRKVALLQESQQLARQHATTTQTIANHTQVLKQIENRLLEIKGSFLELQIQEDAMALEEKDKKKDKKKNKKKDKKKKG